MEFSARKCFRCGALIPAGGLAYQLRLQMSADFDGFLDADSEANSPTEARTALTRIAEQTEEALNDQVYRERTLLCCSICAEQAWRQLTKPNIFINNNES